MRVGYLIDSNVGGGGRSALPPRDLAAALDAMVEEGVAAERAGFASVMAPDRHGQPETAFPGPEQLLTLLARETSRVALGSFTFVGTLVHPMKAAEQFSVIDNLSRGRLATTVSRGFLGAFWDQFGIPRERMLGRFQETLRVWRAAMGGERFTFHGDHWRVDDGMLAPAPFQAGGWPIWGGGNAVQAAIRRSAEYADAWTCDPMPMSRAAWEADAGVYRARAAELGKTPYVVLMRDGWVADSFEEAARTFGEHYVTIARFYAKRGALTRAPELADPAAITARSLAPHLVMGTAQQCIERLEHLKEELGVDHVILCCRVTTGPSLEAAREQILRFGEEVVGPIHRKYAVERHPAIPRGCAW